MSDDADLTPGQLAFVEQGDERTQRPLFFSWQFKTLTAAEYILIPTESIVTVLSKTIRNPYQNSWRLRKVLSPFGVGYMWESELSPLGNAANADGR